MLNFHDIAIRFAEVLVRKKRRLLVRVESASAKAGFRKIAASSDVSFAAQTSPLLTSLKKSMQFTVTGAPSSVTL
jgi:hypothetical protein